MNFLKICKGRFIPERGVDDRAHARHGEPVEGRGDGQRVGTHVAEGQPVAACGAPHRAPARLLVLGLHHNTHTQHVKLYYVTVLTRMGYTRKTSVSQPWSTDNILSVSLFSEAYFSHCNYVVYVPICKLSLHKYLLYKTAKLVQSIFNLKNLDIKHKLG
jgi:hypothetical protein